MEAAALDQKLETLRGAFAGGLILPRDAEYDEARKVFNAMADRRPAVIARPSSDADVIAALALARQAGLEVAIRGGGHSAPGFGTCEGGMVIDLSQMKGIEIDTEERTATAQPGLTWAEFDAATQEHGLAVTGGRMSTTGIAGLTLGSGSGWLERKLGLTGDNLLSARMITAEGQVVTASKDENPELFWGLRGGGGNFGIVTEFKYRLHPVGPIIYGGLLGYPLEKAREVARWYRDMMADAPEEMGGAIAFVSAPPEPFVPEEYRLKRIIGLVVCWTGDIEEGEHIVQPMRDLGPVIDVVQPMPYVAVQQLIDGGNPPGMQNYFKAEFMPGLPDEALELFIEAAETCPSPLCALLLQPLGGAFARVPEDETALGARDTKWCYHCLNLWPDPSENEQQMAWTRALAERLEPYTRPGVHPNYVSDTGTEQVKSFYGQERYARLVALKDQWDPENVFHLNQNIAPSAH